MFSTMKQYFFNFIFIVEHISMDIIQFLWSQRKELRKNGIVIKMMKLKLCKTHIRGSTLVNKVYLAIKMKEARIRH